MRISNPLVALGVVVSLAACGTKQKDDKDSAAKPAPTVSPEEKTARDNLFPKLPSAAIVRVALDDKGQPTGEPELRTVSGAASLTSDGLATAFDSAAPQKLLAAAPTKDELDADTSTQSWGYGNIGYGNNGYGGAGYGNIGYGNAGYGNVGYGNTGYGYGNTGYGYGNTGYGNSYGYGTSGYGGYGYSSYQPVLYWQGYGWNYGNGIYSRGGGYGYSCYTPYRSW